jgi:TPR repeat protein
MTPEDQEMAHVAHFFMPTALDRYVSGPSKQERSASSPNASQSVKPAGSGSVGSFEELLKLDPKHVGKVETKLPTSTNTSMGIPSPAGMDDGILTQATIAKVVEIASELDKLAQDQDRKLGELEKRASALREAFQCFEKGHELDPLNPELLYWLADSYYHGNGIQQDKERATSLYQQSAHLGYAPPQTAIGDAYAQCGLGHVPSQNPNPGSKPTNPNAKGTENAPVESFEELLKLDPRQVQSITVLPRK